MAVTTELLWVPIASGALGIIGALAGTAVTQRATRKREDRRWERERELDRVRYDRDCQERLRERRAALYLDLAEYAQSRETDLKNYTDEYGRHGQPIPDLQHPDRLAARVKLYANPEIGEKWDALVRALDLMQWELTEGSPNYNDTHVWLDTSNQAAVSLRRALQELQIALKAAIGEDS